MPRIGRRDFKPRPVPAGIKPGDPVWLCQHTGEVFKDFETYSIRAIECTQRTWCCATSGKAGLTFAEAKLCEQIQQEKLDEFPEHLKEAAARLIHGFNGGGKDVVLNHVCGKLKDTFQVGEEIEVLDNKDDKAKQKSASVKGVVVNMFQSAPAASATAPAAADTNEAEPPQPAVAPQQTTAMVEIGSVSMIAKKNKKWKPGDDNMPNITVPVSMVRRPKETAVSREVIRMWCGQNSKRVGGDKGPFILLPERGLIEKYGLTPIAAMKLDGLTLSRPKNPSSKASPKPSSEAGKENQAEYEGLTDAAKKLKKLKSRHVSKTKKPSPKMALRIAELESIVKEENRVERARIRKEKLEEQKVETIRRRKEKEEKEKAEKEALREFMRPREDLTLDDLKELPEPSLLQTRVSKDVFGNLLAVAEWLATFGKVIDLGRQVDGAVTFDSLEKALIEQDSSGLLSDIIMHLLVTLFDEDTFSCSARLLGLPIQNIPLDSLTAPEILRLYMIAEGFEDEEATQLIATQTLYQLEPQHKLYVLEFLCYQLLAYSSVITGAVKTSSEEVSALRVQWRDVAQQKNAEAKDRRKFHTEIFNTVKAKFDERLKAANEQEYEDPKERKEKLDGLKEQKRKEVKDEDDRHNAAEEASTLDHTMKFNEYRNEIRRKFLILRTAPFGKDRYRRRYYSYQSIRGLVVEPYISSKDEYPYSDNEDEDVAGSEGEGDSDEDAERSASTESAGAAVAAVAEAEPASGNQPASEVTVDGKPSAAVKAEPGARSVPAPAKALPREEDPMAGILEPEVAPPSEWQRYTSVDQLDALINSLSERGVRERDLRSSLQVFRGVIESSMVVPRTPARKAKKPAKPKEDNLIVKQIAKSLQLDVLKLEQRLSDGALSSIPSRDN